MQWKGAENNDEFKTVHRRLGKNTVKSIGGGECEVRAEKLEEYHGRTPYRILFLKDSDGEQAVVADIYPEKLL